MQQTAEPIGLVIERLIDAPAARTGAAQAAASKDAAQGRAARGPFRPDVWLNARQRSGVRLAAHYFRATDVLALTGLGVAALGVAAPDGLTAVDLPFTGETASPSASPSASATESASAEPTDDGATDQGSGTVVWAVVGGLVVVAAAVAVVVWLRRRGSGAPKATGGR